MKPGDKIPIILEVAGPAEHGEMVTTQGEPFEVINWRGDKWWAVPKGCKGPRILVCSDLDTESKLIERKAIVDLLECGVGC